jgi:shikimate 5-dehydrogenase
MRRFVFVGVTTGSSSIVRIFPRWRDALGLPSDVELAGHDVPIGAPPEAFRDAIAWLRDDEANLGALVTTHKIDVVRWAGDLFDELDPHAQRLGEVSCVARRDGRLLGWAKDPITAARALDSVAPPGCFAGGGHALVLGAGGAGSAIAEHLLHRDDRPGRIVVSDRDPGRLERLAAVDGVETAAADGDANDRLLEALPPGSLVVNATGMGKDRPGSPLSDAAQFPECASVWELNYRGELDFLVQARAQAAARDLRVEDGWRYFIHGWSAVMEEVFQRPLTEDDVDRLAREAEFARPPAAQERSTHA